MFNLAKKNRTSVARATFVALVAAAITLTIASCALAQLTATIINAGENPDTRIVSIMLNIGQTSGVAAGDEFDMTISGRKAGTIRVSDAFENSAFAEMIGATSAAPAVASSVSLERRAAIPAPQKQEPPARVAAPADSPSYRIGPEDTLNIKSYPPGQLPDTATVRPDGSLSLPHIGLVKVEGLTVYEASDLLQEQMKEYFNRPWIEVTLDKQKTKTVRVFGEVLVSQWRVSGPGEYPIPEPMRIIDFIATVGGLTERADLKNIKIMKKSGEEQLVNLEAAAANPRTDSNPPLTGGELIYVPTLSVNQLRVTVLGGVYQQGIVHTSPDKATLADIVSAAKGLLPAASPDEVIVVRTIDGKRTTIEVNLEDILTGKAKSDFIVAAEDVIFVPPRIEKKRAIDKFNDIVKEILPTMNLLVLIDRLAE